MRALFLAALLAATPALAQTSDCKGALAHILAISKVEGRIAGVATAQYKAMNAAVTAAGGKKTPAVAKFCAADQLANFSKADGALGDAITAADALHDACPTGAYHDKAPLLKRSWEKTRRAIAVMASDVRKTCAGP